MIIGLSGYARSGKDTAAQFLVDGWGWQRVAFADKLREFLYRLNPTVIPRVQRAFGAHAEPETVQTVIDKHGWGGYKETPWGAHIREYLQRLGTECGRELISDSIWIDAALPTNPELIYPQPKIVVTDVRFPNEAQAIKDRGGYIVRINREGVGAANDHPSEHALADWLFDAIIDNDGTVEDLHQQMGNVALYLAL